MPKKRFQISEQQAKELQRAYRDAKNAALRTRYQALQLYTQGYAVPQICQITGSNATSLMEWCRKYRQHGVSGLVDHRDGRNRAKLTVAQIQELRENLQLYTPHDLLGWDTHTQSGQHWTVEDLGQMVQSWFGVQWESRTSYHTLFARCGFTYQRSEKVYKSRRDREVTEFEAQVEKN